MEVVRLEVIPITKAQDRLERSVYATYLGARFTPHFFPCGQASFKAKLKGERATDAWVLSACVGAVR